MDKKSEKTCEVCGRKYWARKGRSGGRGADFSSLRRYNSKTCSKKCSRERLHILNWKKENE